MSAQLELPRSWPMPLAAPLQEERSTSLPRQSLIRTGRLTLRRPQIADAGAMAAALGNYDVTRMLTRVPQPYYLEDAEEWLASLPDDAGSDWFFAITLGGLHATLAPRVEIANGKDDNRLVGFVSIEWRETGTRSGWHIGYWLAKDQWGKGIMTEAVNAVLARFFAAQMGGVLFSAAMVDNPASLRIQEKLGFDVTGVEDAYSSSRGTSVRLITTEVTFGSYMPL